MTKDEAIHEKKDAIRQHTLMAVQTIIKAAKKLKKKPRFIGGPVSRKERAGAFGTLFMTPLLLRNKIQAIASQPIPKYPNGSVRVHGISMVHEEGYEMIMKDGGCSINNGRIKSISIVTPLK